MKFTAYLFSVILLIQGVVLSTGNSIYGARMTIEPSTKSILLSFIMSFLLILFTKFIKEVKYSKCPKCKETYTYSKLKDGMCPKCDVKTIDMDKYYDKS